MLDASIAPLTVPATAPTTALDDSSPNPAAPAFSAPATAAAAARARAAEAKAARSRTPGHDARSLWTAAWGEVRAQGGGSLAALRARVPMQRGAGLSDLRDRVIRTARDVRAARFEERRMQGPGLQSRLAAYIARKASHEVAARGGETDIDGVELRLLDRDRAQGLAVVGCDGYRQYSKAFGQRFASLRYLWGYDDNGAFAVRVPASARTVAAAIDAITPAEVRRAHEAGRGVLRQGDVYAVELRTSRVSDEILWGTHHSYDRETRRLVHEDSAAPHRDVVIPISWRGVKFLFQGGLGMGRLGGGPRGRGLED